MATKKNKKKYTEDAVRKIVVKPSMICQYCGKTDKETNFYKARNPKYQFFGKIPWCFCCIKDKYDELYKKYEDSKKAMYELCKYLDMCFSIRIYEIAKNRWQESGVEIFQGYITYYNSVGGKNSGVCFEDSDEIELKEILDSNGDPQEIPQEYIFDWGEGFTLDEYEYLDQELAKCKETLRCDTWSEETLLREICIKKLDVRNKRITKQDTQKDLKDLQDLMKTCAVDPSKSTMANAGKSMDAFGVWIKDIEQKEPAEWYKDQKKYKDIDNLEDYIKKYITRPIKNFITGSKDFNVDKEIMIDLDKAGDE